MRKRQILSSYLLWVMKTHAFSYLCYSLQKLLVLCKKKKDKKNQQLFFPTVSDKQYNEGTGGMGTQANLCAIDD